MRRIQQNQNLRYFYDRNNQSLIAYAINKNKSNIVNKLINFGLKIGNHENIAIENMDYLNPKSQQASSKQQF